MDFRPDINALRAVAVLLVALFHFELLGVKGGFIGVDVFFCISGFLMTALILKYPVHGFSFAGFYAARARRILPALLVMCAAVAAFGWFLLSPSDYTLYGEHWAASVSFISNFVYRGEEGYFDTPSKFKWLLHTWSLSVEWQFYLLYPLFLHALRRKWPDTTLTKALLIVAIFSFALSVIIGFIRPVFAFYLLPTRIWEMVAAVLSICTVMLCLAYPTEGAGYWLLLA